MKGPGTLSYEVEVQSDQATYPIHILSESPHEVRPATRSQEEGPAADVLDAADRWTQLAERVDREFRPTQVVVASDHNVHGLYGAVCQAAFEARGLRVTSLVCPAGESSKQVHVAEQWWQALAEAAIDRQAVVVALGGGVVGDLTGFVAATYLRGLRMVQVPTSLLAQVDSSVGGKVAVNLQAGKNLGGCFWQPSLVWIDPSVLTTLSPREFAAGMAEVIKYAILLAGLLDDWERQTDDILARDPAVMAPLIECCCRIKADVVARDPRETEGIRAILNFGHTIGHAIEKLTGYDSVLHGEAVSMGMVAEARLAERTGICPGGLADRLQRILGAYGLPTQLPDFNWADWQAAMLRDKKNIGQRIAFALPWSIGDVRLCHDVPLEDVEAVCRLS